MKRKLALFLVMCVVTTTAISPVGWNEVQAEEVEKIELQEKDSDEDKTLDNVYEEERFVEESDADENGFIIREGTLIEYHGDGGDVVIPDSVTSIGERAFSTPSGINLTSVEIPNSVKSIGDFAFHGCIKLTSLEIPSSVKSIGSLAFWDCRNLDVEWFYENPKTGSNIFLGCHELKIKILDSVTNIKDSEFMDYSNLVSVEIPNSVTSIGNSAFLGCSSLASIEIPDSVTAIANYTFSGCSSLASIEIPNSVTEIGSNAFSGCSSLASIEIPNGVTSIGNSAFSGCSTLTSIEIPDSVTAIANYTFSGCSSLTSIEIPNSVTEIGSNAFSGCSSLTSIEIPNSVKSIGDFAFYGCINLTSLEIPNGVRSLDGTFSGCSSLSSIKIPNSVMEIRSRVFSGCSSLTSIEIPESVTSIWEMAFSGCNNLTSIEIPDSVTAIADYTFSGCSSLTSIEIPNSVTEIGSNAFSGCSSLTSIEIPNSVTEIWDGAFSGCSSLTSIEIPNGVRSLDGTFSGCSSLSSIKIPDSVTSIGNSTFSGCSSLTSIEIPNSVTEIGYDTFLGCSSLASIKIPNSVTSIKYSAFDECGDKLCIYCEDGSYAQTYAEINKIAYKISKKTQVILANDVIKTEGDTMFPIGASTDGNGTLSYESSNENVASVSEDGMVTIKGQGIAQITITASETENYDQAQKVITITVNPKQDTGEFVIENGILVRYSGNGGDVVIPDSVTNIGNSAFLSCSGLTSVIIPSSVTNIGDLAFANCSSLASIEIPDGTVKIGDSAFAGCSSLASIKISNSVTSIGDSAFDECGDKLCIYCEDGSYAQAYAKANGIAYKTNKKKQVITANDIVKKVGDVPFQLGASTDGDGILSYQSSSQSVAVVSSDGTVTIIGAGTAQITIHASETDTCMPAQKTVTITVSPKPDDGNNQNQGQVTDVEKIPQTITAYDMTKTYGVKPFSLGAYTDGGGTLTYIVTNPKVAAVDANGKVTVKGCGITEIEIYAAAHGQYDEAEETITLTVEPQKPSSLSAKSQKAKTLTVKWKKDAKASGYIIECSTDKKFKKNRRTVTIQTNKTSSKKVTKLKAGKKYYVRICAYVAADGRKLKGAYRTLKKAVKVRK